MAGVAGSTETIEVYDDGQRVCYSVQFDAAQLYECESFEGVAYVLSQDYV